MKLQATGLSVLFSVCLSAPLWGQSKASGQQKSCDGVLDVIPTKSLTFTRKRRPAKEANAPLTATPSASGNAQKTSRKKSR